jgi:hypothetical protein
VYATTDIQVYVDGVLKTISTDYSVTLTEGGLTGGRVTFVTTPTNGQALIIQGSLALTQGESVSIEGKLPAKIIENALDRTVILVQQLKGEVDRCLKVGVSQSTTLSTTIGSITPVAGYALVVNNTADGFTLSTSSFTTAVTAAAASATAAATSATSASSSATSAATSASTATTQATNASASATAAAASAAAVNLRTINAQSGNYTVLATDRNKLVDYTGSGGHTFSLTAAATLGTGFEFHVRNSGSGSVTLDPNASETIDGSASIALSANQAIVLVCDGSNWKVTQSRGYGAGAGTVTSVSASNGVGTLSGSAITGSGQLIGATGFTSKSANYTVLDTDRAVIIDCTGTFTLSFSAVATLAIGFYCWVVNKGTGVITLDPNGSETIDGSTTITVYPDESFMVAATAAGIFRTVGRRPLTGLPLLYGAPSGAATVDIAGATYFNSSYDVLELHLYNIAVATDSVDIWARVSLDNGSTWKSGASDYRYSVRAGYTDNYGGSTGDSKIIIAGGITNAKVGNSTNENGGHIILRLYNPNQASTPKMISATGHYCRDFDGVPETFQGSGQYVGATSAVNGIRILASSGNISMTYALYGRKLI